MRIVKWSPQERVDTPDLTAMSYLALGEFRRMTRGVLLGDADATPNYIINGFAVEPQVVPDATARVRLDISGALSYALGAELIGSRVDYGQLIGGDDSNGNTEGNATQTIDLTGQPANTYTVEMRFLYTDGVVDNRAFWNPTGNTEFISAVPTRTLSGFNLRFTGAPSAEWIPLADIVWTGGGDTIEAGDITDLREFAFEGTTPFLQTTALGAGGMANFSRTANRSNSGMNAIYPALRGLARQIQDIKGADDGGTWNWYNTPYRPFNPSNTLGFDQTTSLRSLRTVHFTVGDGVRTFGDFNGYTLGNGLDACLSHIETEDANMQCHIIVQILVNGDAAGNDEFEIGNYTFDRTLVEIRGGGGNPTGSGVLWWGSRIKCAGTLTTEAFNVAGSSFAGLILRNLNFTSTGSATELVNVATQNHFEMENCNVDLEGTVADPTFEIGGVNILRLVNVRFNSSYILCNGSIRTGRGVLDSCEMSNAEVFIDNGHNISFRDCEFSTASTTVKLVTITDSSGIHFDRCRLSGSGVEEDVVHIDRSGGDWQDIWFSDCIFSGFLSTVPHAVDTGGNGAFGTGWHIYADNTSGAAGTGGLNINNCRFRGHQNMDAGGVGIVDGAAVLIHGCEFTGFDIHTTAAISGRVHSVGIFASATNHAGRIRVTDNTIHAYGTATVGGARYGIFGKENDGLVISGNRAGTLGNGLPNVGIYLDGCRAAVISGNVLSDYLVGNVGVGIRVGNEIGCSITGNTFVNCFTAIDITGTGGYHAVSGNNADGSAAAASSNGVLRIASINNSITGNVIHNYSGAYDAIDIFANAQIIMSNRGDGSGRIDANGTTGHVGHLEAQDVNNGFTYIV